MEEEINFALCISSDGCDDIDVGRIYRVLRDASDEFGDLIRIIDETGEDFLYPIDLFYKLNLPDNVIQALGDYK